MKKALMLIFLLSFITLVLGCTAKQAGAVSSGDRYETIADDKSPVLDSSREHDETIADDKSPVLEFGCYPDTVSCKPGDTFDLDVIIKNVSSSDFSYWPFRDNVVLVNDGYKLYPTRRIQNDLYYEEPVVIRPGEYDREGCLHDLFTVPDDAPAGVYDLEITMPDSSGNIYTGIVKEVCAVRIPQ